MAHPPGKRPSSKDVADAAGVSRTTVSFVLNDKPDSSIPEATRNRVLEAAEQLGYFPSPEARALKMGRSPIVLCLLPDWPIGGPIGVFLKQVSAHLGVQGLTMLAHQRDKSDDLARVLQAATPTAIVAMCDLTAAEVDFVQRRGLALTSWMGSIPGHPDQASFKQSDLGRLQVTALADLGHTHVGYASPADPDLKWFSGPRLEGARERAADLGIRLEEFELGVDRSTVAPLLESTLSTGLTGICAYNDEVAYSLIVAAEDLGKKVPDDLSVIGVDNLAISELARPAISTIAFDLVREAERLSQHVSESKMGSSHPRDSAGDVFNLILRESTTEAKAR